MPNHVMHVVSHTHWDREWYLPFQRFRIRLVDLMDHVVEILERDPDFKHFNLDGQTIILEDYLQIKPEKRETIERLAQEGRLVIGPWYVLNDEFIVSGEATIRSLLMGHRHAREFGPVMKVGYLPDQFGNISQMPQILQGFGIDNAVFGRGLHVVEGRKMEFWWESPDGSRVLSSLMAFWYNNAQRFPANIDEAVSYTSEIRDRMRAISHVKDLLLMNGVDHLEAQPDLSGILASVNERLNGDRLVHSTLPAYVDALRDAIRSDGAALDTIAGELRDDRWGNVLAGTLSSRMYIKQANEQCQTALEKCAEPLASLAHSLGTDYPAGLLRYAWKLLMQNHPHDSICGCSIDQVHREMMPRFDQVRQIADELTQRSLAAIAGRISTQGRSLVVFNPLNWIRTDKVRAVVDFPAGEPKRGIPSIDESMVVGSMRLLDPDGVEVPISILSAEITAAQLLDPHDLPRAQMVKRFVIEFVAQNMPPCGYRAYRIEAASHSVESEQSADQEIGNEFLRVAVRGGSVIVECIGEKPSSFAGVNVFEDRGEVGDEYYHRKPDSDLVITGLGANPRVTAIDNSPVSATLKIETSLDLPAEADEGKSARSARTVECPITSYLTVTTGVPRVDVVTVVENRAKDHRLRVLFPTGIDARSSFAEGQFDVIERPLRLPEDWENASTFHPQQRWVDVSDGERGLCIINKGLPEYELYPDENRTIALTLLRCVGTLNDGPIAPGVGSTPEAQCLGTHTFEYSIYPHEGNWETAQVWRQAHQHNVPLMAIQTTGSAGELPPESSFLEVTGPELIVSAIKKAEDSDLLVVRLYNTTTSDVRNARIRARGARSAKLLNLNEEPIGEVAFSNETASLPVGAKKIITLGFELDAVAQRWKA